MPSEIKITFPDELPSKQAKLVQKLSECLESAPVNIYNRIEKDNPDTQDAGTILTIILTGPAVIAAVRAIQMWMTRENQSGMTFEDVISGKRVVVNNMNSEDIPKIIKAFNL